MNANGLPSVKSIEQLIPMLLVTNILKLIHRVVTVVEIEFNNRGKFNLRNDDCWVRIEIK